MRLPGLADYPSRQDRRIHAKQLGPELKEHLADITAILCETYNLLWDDLKSPQRKKKFLEAINYYYLQKDIEEFDPSSLVAIEELGSFAQVRGKLVADALAILTPLITLFEDEITLFEDEDSDLEDEDSDSDLIRDSQLPMFQNALLLLIVDEYKEILSKPGERYQFWELEGKIFERSLKEKKVLSMLDFVKIPWVISKAIEWWDKCNDEMKTAIILKAYNHTNMHIYMLPYENGNKNPPKHSITMIDLIQFPIDKLYGDARTIRRHFPHGLLEVLTTKTGKRDAIIRV